MGFIDLNADMGESFGVYKIGADEELMQYVTSVNIACGMHAGDPVVISKTISIAKKYNVCVGAHPGYPDIQGFGRRYLELTPEEIEYFTIYQLGAIYAFCKANNVNLTHVKPHGALYNVAAKDYTIALAIAKAIKRFDSSLILVGLYNSKLIDAGKELDLKVAEEVFADRAYDDNGFLVSRKIEGSVIKDSNNAANKALNIVKNNKVTTITGKTLDIRGSTICLHGDNPNVLDFAKTICSVLKNQGIKILPLTEIVKSWRK